MPLPSDRRLRSLLGGQTADVAQIQQQLMENHSILLSYWIGETIAIAGRLHRMAVSVDVLPPRDQLERVLLPLEHMLQRRRPLPLAGEDISGLFFARKGI